jgi:uncharacterized protein YegP (UPF0339 family)
MKQKIFIKKHISENNKPYFTLNSVNGKVLLTSELYESNQACHNSMKIFQENLLECNTVDTDGNDLLLD